MILSSLNSITTVNTYSMVICEVVLPIEMVRIFVSTCFLLFRCSIAAMSPILRMNETGAVSVKVGRDALFGV